MTAPTVLDQGVVENDIVNTLSETDLISYTVPGGTLGSTHALRVTIQNDYLNNSGATRTFTIKVKYGATTMYEDVTASIAASASRYPITMDLILFPKNATNSQGLTGFITFGTAGGATTGIGDLATDEIIAVTGIVGVNASEDSTAAKTFKVTITHSTNDASLSFRRMFYCIEQM